MVHVLPDGEEVDYATPPADVPTLLVTVITMRATYIEHASGARAGTAGAMTAPMAVVRGG